MTAALRVVAVVAVMTVLLLATLVIEGVAAARHHYLGAAEALQLAGSYPAPHASRSHVSLLMMGDSTAAGVGASSAATSVGGDLARALAADGHDIALRSVAVSGARVAHLRAQVDQALQARPNQPELAVILIGANDATHLTRLSTLRHALAADVDRLTQAGVEVVVGTCPQMRGAIALARPLRDLVGWRGEQVASSQRRALRPTDAIAVDLAALTGPAFIAHPHRYLARDHFHPDDAGYQLWATALMPSVLAALSRAPVS